MSLASIRSLFETALSDAYQALAVPVPVVFDNVQETPPAGEFVIVSLSFPELTTPVLCIGESGMDAIRGNCQVACYTPRAIGMKRVEELAVLALSTLNTLQATTADPVVRMGAGTSTPVLSGDSPHALVTVAVPFTARVA